VVPRPIVGGGGVGYVLCYLLYVDPRSPFRLKIILCLFSTCLPQYYFFLVRPPSHPSFLSSYHSSYLHFQHFPICLFQKLSPLFSFLLLLPASGLSANLTPPALHPASAPVRTWELITTGRVRADALGCLTGPPGRLAEAVFGYADPHRPADVRGSRIHIRAQSGRPGGRREPYTCPSFFGGGGASRTAPRPSSNNARTSCRRGATKCLDAQERECATS